MNIEDIKSPLPPRKVNFETETDVKEINQRVSLVNGQEVNSEGTPTGQPVNIAPPKSNKKLVFVLVGIVVLILIGLFFIFSKKRKLRNK